MIEIIKVNRENHWQQYFQVAREIYRGDPLWTPLPENSQRLMFNRQANPVLKHVVCELFLAINDKGPVGRIAAITDDFLPDKKVGFFGCFETINSQEIALALLDAAAKSLKNRGKKQIQGPVTLNTSQQVGLLVEGFKFPPQMMMPYNPPYYQRLLETAGFEKLLDLYAYPWKPEYTRNRKTLTAIAKRASRIPGVRVRPINLNDPMGEGNRLAEIHNKAMTEQWGFVPLTQEEAAHYLREMRSYADPDLLTFCEVDHQPVGVCLIMPDIGHELRASRRSPFSMLHNMFGPKSLRVGVLAVIPEYRRKGVVALLIDRAIDIGLRKGYNRGEMSLIMDSNEQMNRIITSKVVGKAHKVFRIYHKTNL
ncbi:hypothetical protein N752_02225 [Desulforamulus aquiferis]|nr:GNAT family N-acetyltransferase [Desulforamulus aquiferis]RYD06771.1 hypothetical protein N752_02225 [Desulforamulus aquiferis]